MAAFGEYSGYDGLGLANLVQKKEVTAAELLEAAISQVDALNPKVNAVIDRFFDEASKSIASLRMDAPFCGVPFLMKDILTPFAGRPFRSGSRLYGDYTPDHDGEMAIRYKEAGVVIIGKTNAPEFGLMPVTEPELFGPTRNPWDLSRTSGGSSGGGTNGSHRPRQRWRRFDPCSRLLLRCFRLKADARPKPDWSRLQRVVAGMRLRSCPYPLSSG
jgi:amidase